jgi:plastocyanin
LLGALSATVAAIPAAAQGVVAHIQLEGAAGKTHVHAAESSFHTVVWLTPVDRQQAESQAQAPRSVTMVQQGKMFTPHMLVLPVGSTVSFPNKDPFFHNVFSLFNGRRFDLGLYQSGQTRSVVFNRVGVSYIFCNIHPEMSAVILALDTPYFASPDVHGDVAITDVPAGAYTLQVWSEATSPAELQMLTRRVTVNATGSSDVGQISIHAAPGILAEHRNKFGEPYDTHAPPDY